MSRTLSIVLVLCAARAAFAQTSSPPLSMEQAVAIAVADLMTMTADEFEWAKPLIEAGLAEAERGQTISGDEAIADLEAIVRKPR